MWLLLSGISAFFLGMYDVAKKRAVTDNAVLPVLFFSTLSGVICTVPVIVLSFVNPTLARQWHIFIPRMPLAIHALIMAKSSIVGISWVLSYFGLKHLPITIASPLRATAPIFTVLGAVWLFGERPAFNQWVGIVLIVTSYLGYSRVSRGGNTQKVPIIWIVFMILSAVTGAMSAGFDKYLLQSRALPPLFVLYWFLLYLSVMYGIVTLVCWFPQRVQSTPFRFHVAIILVGILLIIADIAYMTALSSPDAKLAIVSSIRRSNVLISFTCGALLFREGSIRKKLLPFAGIITGLVLIMA